MILRVFRIFIIAIIFLTLPSCIHSQSSRNLSVALLLPHQIHLKSTSLTSNSALAYKFYFTTNHVPFFMINAFKSQNDTKAAFDFTVAILGLVEYNDTIGIKDSKSLYSFIGKDQLWSNIKKTEETNGLKGIETTLIAHDLPGSIDVFNATISAYATGNTTTINKNGITLKPSQIKYSFEFNNFPYIYQNSKISIIKMIFSESVFTYNNSTAYASDYGKFEWDPTILADSKKVDIQLDQKIIFQKNHTFENITADNSSSVQAYSTLKEIAFKVQAIQPKNVLWDPQFDINDPNDNSVNKGNTNDASRLIGLFGVDYVIRKVGLVLTIIVTSGFLFI
ncbi:2928_t:CDS:2 [Cetraspora pellucida]|uniref:2928_t:CDS:1 n=1 Tax=Cetraspora pellucida TaxID=1433469 RepID=A0A9N9EJE4_9GLOM|nr:2928_t:CDS:2 [Cetraspora pellucida]